MMKRLLIAGAVAFSAISLNAQVVPNGGFENWSDQGGYDEPNNWGTLNFFSLTGAPAGTTQTNDAHSGNSAAKIETTAFDFDSDGLDDTIPGVAFLGEFDLMGGEVVFGAPFVNRPDSLVGWFKYATTGTDDAFLLEVTLTKWNELNEVSDIIATIEYTGTDIWSNYTRLALPLNYESADIPDSVQLAISTDGGNTFTPGTAVWVDDLVFKTNGFASTPELSATLGIQYYPNPANQSMTIVSPKNTTIRVYNALGMEVEILKANASEKVSLSTAGYHNGVYFLKTESGELERFVVQH
jgi:hypothetical protein